MPDGIFGNPGNLVEPDRVHKACYTDDGIFEQELDKIFHKSWIYIGHETQVPKVGDYWTTWVGRERMILCRGEDGVHVLYNRCPHRGAMLCCLIPAFGSTPPGLPPPGTGLSTKSLPALWLACFMMVPFGFGLPGSEDALLAA